MGSVEVDLITWLSQFYNGAFYVYRKPPALTLWGMRLNG